LGDAAGHDDGGGFVDADAEELRVQLHEAGHIRGAFAGEEVLIDGAAGEEAEALLVSFGRHHGVAERVAARHVFALDAGPGGRPADDAAAVGSALTVAMAYDPEAYRAFLDIIGVIALPQDVLARPGLVDKVLSIAESQPPPSAPGPSREELLRLVA
jgi:hypothetical protein